MFLNIKQGHILISCTRPRVTNVVGSEIRARYVFPFAAIVLCGRQCAVKFRLVNLMFLIRRVGKIYITFFWSQLSLTYTHAGINKALSNI